MDSYSKNGEWDLVSAEPYTSHLDAEATGDTLPTGGSQLNTEANLDLLRNECRHPECAAHVPFHNGVLGALRVRGEGFPEYHRPFILLRCPSDDL